MRRHLVAVVLIALVFASASCGGAHTPSSNSSSRSSHDAETLTATDRDDGRTISLHPGQRLRVVLSSTYWMLHESSNPAVLRLEGQPQVTPEPSGCVVGAGCGTATATYIAVAAGRTLVTATRSTCGEAMGCTSASGQFTLHVVVG